MKIKVIFIPYWSLATIGLSLLYMAVNTICNGSRRGRGIVHESKHLSADVKG